MTLKSENRIWSFVSFSETSEENEEDFELEDRKEDSASDGNLNFGTVFTKKDLLLSIDPLQNSGSPVLTRWLRGDGSQGNLLSRALCFP